MRAPPPHHYLTALPRPRVPPIPLPIPPRVVLESTEPLVPVPDNGGGAAILDPPTPPRDPVDPVLLVPLKPLVGVGLLSAAAFLASAAKASLSLSATRSRSCSRRRSASCALWADSASMSSRSCVAPCQCPDRSSRCVCSVWLKIRIHRSSRVLADATVEETVCRAEINARVLHQWLFRNKNRIRVKMM